MESEFKNRNNHTVNIDPTLDAIQNFLNYRDSASLSLVEVDVKRLLRQLSKYDNLHGDADLLFKFLDKIQYELAKLVFKHHVEVTKFLRKFVRDFDNLESPDIRKYLLKQVKEESYFTE
jgi:sulfur relay (sulfurtransferase) DsrC/TusE family protein